MNRYDSLIEKLRMYSRVFPNISYSDVREGFENAADSIESLQNKVTYLEACVDKLSEELQQFCDM